MVDRLLPGRLVRLNTKLVVELDDPILVGGRRRGFASIRPEILEKAGISTWAGDVKVEIQVPQSFSNMPEVTRIIQVSPY